MTSTASAPAPAAGIATDRPTHLLALDGYRAVAAIMVLLTHVAFSTGALVASTWGHILGRLDFGVTLFFLLSGFLLYRPWAKAALHDAPTPALTTYAKRRAARILPLYWLVVVVVLLTLPELRPVSASTWWRHVFAVQIYGSDGTVEGLTQTWSLCTEIAFYAVLPVLGWLALGGRRGDLEARWRRQWSMLATCVVIALVFVGVRAFTGVLPNESGYWLPFYLDWFAAGMGLAVLEASLRLAEPPRVAVLAQRLARDEWTAVAVAVALFAVVATPLGGGYAFNQATGPWEMLARHVLYCLIGVAILAPCVLGGDSWLTRALSRRGPHRVGLISYGVFLWHVFLLRVIMTGLGIPLFSGGFWLVAALVLGATLVVSAVTYRLVERPAQRWAQRAAPSSR